MNTLGTTQELLSIHDDSGRRLLALRNDSGRLIAEYDPADLDAAARRFFDTVVKTVPEDIAELIDLIERLVYIASTSGPDEDLWEAESRAEALIARYRASRRATSPRAVRRGDRCARRVARRQLATPPLNRSFNPTAAD